MTTTETGTDTLRCDVSDGIATVTFNRPDKHNALSMEMQARGRPVKVTCVHPGGIRTNVARNAAQVDGLDHDALATSFDKVARTSPTRAAQVILDGVARGRTRVLIGADARVIDLVSRVAGPRYQRLVARFSGKAGL